MSDQVNRISRLRGPLTAEAFFEHVTPEPNSGCWLWEGMAGKDGYGRLNVRRKLKSAHRVAYELVCGPISAGAHIMHSCDVPLCCNPAHLSLGTAKLNQADCAAKGRKPRGDRHYKAILSEAKVRELRADFAAGLSLTAVAVKHGLGRSTVLAVKTRRAWAWLP